MNTALIEQIKQEFGDRATDSLFERTVYSRDLAPVPDLLVKPLFHTVPDVVVRPQDTAEVAVLMKQAWSNQIAVTPRAGASTVYFNTVPVKGSILMDLNLIKGIVNLDEKNMTVTVRTATTWKELDECLNERGLALKSFPSSAPVATIGGWFCMMGYGIGSIKYGSLFAQVKAIEVVLPDGSIKKVDAKTNPPLDWFISSEGTLGIVTELQLEVRQLKPMKHYIIKFDTITNLAETMAQVINGPVKPYNVHFSESHSLKVLQKLGLDQPEVADKGGLLGIDYEGDLPELKQADKFITDIIGSNKAAEGVDQETAELEWEEKFKALRAKRGGPSVLGAEVWLPVKFLPEYLADVEKMAPKYGLELYSYGHVVTPEYATVMTSFYADETKVIKYILNLSLVKKIQDIGYRYGGYPYGVGLWNTPYVGRIHQVPELKELRARKRRLDPKGIMNPGKVYRSPLLLNPFNFAVAMDVLAGVRRVVGRGDN